MWRFPRQFVVRQVLPACLVGVLALAPEHLRAEEDVAELSFVLQPLPPPIDVQPRVTVDPAMSIYPEPPALEVLPVEALVVTDEDGEDAAEAESACRIDSICNVYHYAGSGELEKPAWVVGTGDRLGIFTFACDTIVNTEPDKLHFELDAVIHFVSGPHRTDLPPQFYDLYVQLQRFGNITDCLRYDCAIRPGFYADFRGSAREGARIPGHGVFYYRTSETTDLVWGVDVYDRDDYSLLPVGGVVVCPDENWRLEAVFPRPRITHRLANGRAVYVAAEMGGNMWAMERDWKMDDVVTYRDFRIVMGFESSNQEILKFFEVGYVFDRRLEYRSGVGNYKPLDTTILRSVVRF